MKIEQRMDFLACRKDSAHLFLSVVRLTIAYGKRTFFRHKPLKWVEATQEEIWEETPISFPLADKEAQQLMDTLWEAGVRPSKWVTREGNPQDAPFGVAPTVVMNAMPSVWP